MMENATEHEIAASTKADKPSDVGVESPTSTDVKSQLSGDGGLTSLDLIRLASRIDINKFQLSDLDINAAYKYIMADTKRASKAVIFNQSKHTKQKRRSHLN